MRSSEGIGIGGVVSEIGWLSHSKRLRVPYDELVYNLSERFDCSHASARDAIYMAEKFNVIKTDGQYVEVEKEW